MKNILILGSLFFFLLLTGCEKDYSTSEVVIIDSPVSFATDIQPIFNTDCAIPTCHVGGGPPPDLEAGNAYDALTGLGYVDTTNAEESLLYKRIISTSSPMPPSGKLSAQEIGLVLAWIKQGAQQN